VDVVGLPEFLRCMEDSIRTGHDGEVICRFLYRIGAEHTSAEMRMASIRIEGTDIRLWATEPLRLSLGTYRLTWRYEQWGGATVIVCFTLAATGIPSSLHDGSPEDDRSAT